MQQVLSQLAGDIENPILAGEAPAAIPPPQLAPPLVQPSKRTGSKFCNVSCDLTSLRLRVDGVEE